MSGTGHIIPGSILDIAYTILHKHREAIEETVFFHTADLMNLEVSSPIKNGPISPI